MRQRMREWEKNQKEEEELRKKEVSSPSVLPSLHHGLHHGKTSGSTWWALRPVHNVA